MGTWGPGNMENDDAGAFLDALIESLTQTIMAYLDLELMSKQGYWERYAVGKLLPAMDIVITLCKHYDAAFQVEEEIVKDWKERFLKFFDQLTNVYSEDHSKKRREIIIETLEKLHTLSVEFNA
jgi:predicted ABC-type exoprotein transport system permease subunit